MTELTKAQGELKGCVLSNSKKRTIWIGQVELYSNHVQWLARYIDKNKRN